MNKYIKRFINILCVISISLGIASAQTLKISDLYGIWVSGITSPDNKIATVLVFKSNGTGLEEAIIDSQNYQFKIIRNFSWQFNESTRELTQKIEKYTFISAEGEESVQPKEAVIKEIKVLSLHNTMVAIYIVDSAGSEQLFLKINPRDIKELIQ